MPRNKAYILTMVLLGAFAVTGCSGNSKPITVKTEAITADIIQPAWPSRVTAPKGIEPVIVTPERAQRWLNEGDSFVIYGFDESDWLTIGKWNEDKLRYIHQLEAVVEYYMKATAPKSEDTSEDKK